MPGLKTACIAVLFLGVLSSASAETYPSQPLKLVVPFAAGGSSDLIARLIAKPLGEVLGQPVVVSNVPGAGGTIGASSVARAAPDGYTVLFSATGPNAVAPSIYANLPYDPIKSFSHVSMLTTQPSIVAVNPSLGISSLEELIAAARAAPGKLNFGSPGVGTTAHLAGELFQSLANVSITHVPYKVGQLALQDLIQGRIQVMFDNVGQFLPFISTGRVDALAVISDHRTEILPDVKTTAEAGMPGFEYAIWFGISAPAGTPEPVVSALNAKISEAMHQAETQSSLKRLNAEVRTTSPDEFQKFIAQDIGKWAKVVDSAGMVRK